MLRSGASRSVLRSLNAATQPALKTQSSPLRQQLRSQLCTISYRPQAAPAAKALVPKGLVWVRGATTSTREPVDKINMEQEEAIQKRKLPTSPETVSQDSTIMPMTGGVPGDDGAHEQDPEMMSGIKSDLVCTLPVRVCSLGARN